MRLTISIRLFMMQVTSSVEMQVICSGPIKEVKFWRKTHDLYYVFLIFN